MTPSVKSIKFFKKLTRLGLFLVGDSVRKGFVQLAFQGYSGSSAPQSPRKLKKQNTNPMCDSNRVHLSCCSSLKLLKDLLDPFQNPFAKNFLSVYGSFSSEKFIMLGLQDHLEVKGMKKCKFHSYELLNNYKELNFDFEESSMFYKENELNKYL